MATLEIKKSIPRATTPLKRFIEAHPKYEQALKFFDQKELKGLGIMAVSLTAGLIARGELSFDAIGNWLTERASGWLGVDTGPTTLNPFIEGASSLAFITSLGYVVGGKVFDNIFKGTLKRQGLEPLPKKGRKMWKDHTVVIDVTRGMFDAIEELKPNDKVVLVHDGRLIREGEVDGGSLNSDTRRNLNSVGMEHLSDTDFQASMNPESAKEIIINLCSVDNILGSFSGEESHSKRPLNTDKTFNILLTLKNQLKNTSKSGRGPKIKLLVPEGLEIQKIIDLVGPGLDIEFKTPESIFVQEVMERTDQKGALLQTDIEDLPRVLISSGLKVTNESNTIFVYCSTDDATILEAAKLKKYSPHLKVVACIERKTNMDEAKAVSDFVWEIPSIVAQKI